MKSQELKKAKRDLRTMVLAARDGLPSAERSRLGERITERFLSLPEVEGARIVMLFWSFGSEVPTRPLLTELHARGVVTALPRILEGMLSVRSYEPGDALTPTSFGAMEPAVGTPIAPDELDVVCTPGVVFDLRCHRVGYGGGFYDRFLPLTRRDALCAGVAFDLQIVDRDLPAGSFDLPIDLVVTESRILRRGERHGRAT